MKTRFLLRNIVIILAIVFIMFISVYPYIRYNSVQSVITPDFVNMLIRTQQIENEKSIPWDNDYMNIATFENKIGRDPDLTYPLGFQLFLLTVKETAGFDLNYLSLISIILWPLYTFLIYLVALKLTKNKIISIFSAFFSATILSGGIMLGPLYPLPTTLGVILIFFVIHLNFQLSNLFKKVILLTLILTALFVSHRSSMIFWAILLIVLTVVLLIFNTNRKQIFQNYVSSLWISTLFGLVCSYFLIYKRILLSEIAASGTMFGRKFFFVPILSKYTASFDISIALVFVFALVAFIYLLNKKVIANIYQATVFNFRVRIWVLILAFIAYFGLVFAVMLPTVLSFLKDRKELIFQNPIVSLYSFWNDYLSNEQTVTNYVYIIHLGLIFFLLLPILIVFVIKNIKNNLYMQYALSSLLLILIVERFGSEVTRLGSRVYYYISPIMYVLLAISIYYFIKRLALRPSPRLKNLFIVGVSILAFVSIIFSIVHIQTMSPIVTKNSQSAILWADENKQNSSLVFTQERLASSARMLTQSNTFLVNYRINFFGKNIDKTAAEMRKNDAEFLLAMKYTGNYYETFGDATFNDNDAFDKNYDSNTVKAYSLND